MIVALRKEMDFRFIIFSPNLWGRKMSYLWSAIFTAFFRISHPPPWPQKYEHSEFRYEIDSRALPNDEKLLRVQVVDSPYR